LLLLELPPEPPLDPQAPSLNSNTVAQEICTKPNSIEATNTICLSMSNNEPGNQAGLLDGVLKRILFFVDCRACRFRHGNTLHQQLHRRLDFTRAGLRRR